MNTTAAGVLDQLFQPFDPSYIRDPYPAFQRMREEDPVHWSEAFQAWFLTRHRDVAAAAKEPRLISGKRTSAYCEARFTQAGLDVAVLDAFLARMNEKMDELDGAAHQQVRTLARPAFRASALDALRVRIQATVDRLLAPLAASDSFDFAASFAHPLPWTTICDILGVPDSRQDRDELDACRRATSVLFTCPISGLAAAGAGAAEAEQRYERYFHHMLATQRADPGDNLAGEFLRAEARGEITEPQIIAQLILLLGAGASTVTDAVCNALHTLLTHPDAMEQVRGRPGSLATVVDELLRFNTPLPFMTRVAAESLPFAGVRIRQGDVVFLGYGAANRDPEVFPQPDKLDFSRHGAAFTFGHGPHVCLGSALARIEIEILLRTVLQAFPKLRLDPERPAAVKASNLMSRGFHSLPVRVG